MGISMEIVEHLFIMAVYGVSLTGCELSSEFEKEA
jgi:hypothetical protein